MLVLLQECLVYRSQKESAKVTSLEPSSILHDMLKDNAQHYGVEIEAINESFENIETTEIKNSI